MSLSGKIIGGEEATLCHGRIHEYLNLGQKNFVIDMGKVEWTNSQGLGMLIGCYVSVTKAGGRMVLARITNIQALLAMTRLLQVFDCYDSVEEAKEALTAGQMSD
jgi:anti-anti-sigma factor